MSASDGGGALPATVRVKEEQQWDDEAESGAGAAAADDLYVEHEVKDELVLGPQRLQPQDIAYALHVSERVDKSKNYVTEEQLAAGAEDGRPEKEPVQSGGADSVLRPCIVKLECISIEELMHACTICHKTFLQEASLETHVCAQGDSEISVHSNHAIGDETCSNTKMYVCDNCRKKFAFKSDLVRHLKINVEEPHICKICEKLFSNICSLHDHVRVHFTCDICLKVFRYIGNLKRHMASHSGKKRYSCEICNESFKWHTSLPKHLLLHTGDQLHSCEICQKRFTFKLQLIKHKLTHLKVKTDGKHIRQFKIGGNEERSYLAENELDRGKMEDRSRRDGRPACDICSKTFSDLRCLANHKLIHSQTKPFSCDVCKLAFRYRADLIPHMRVHSGDKPYSCDICKKNFRQYSTLTAHMSIHSGEKPFACEICHKAFNYRTSLNIHKLVHTEDRPYMCEICDKKFKSKPKLKEHKLHTHSRHISYVCDTCRKPFFKRYHLVRHLVTHTKHLPYSCDICNKRFRLVAYLDRHMSVHLRAKPSTCDVRV